MGLYENKNGVLSPIAGRGNIDGVYKAQGILGAKNLLKVNGESSTVKGITYTINSDGTITLDDGTAEGGTSTLPIVTTGSFADSIYAHEFILSGTPSSLGSDDYCLQLRDLSNNHIYYNGHIVTDTGNGVTVDFSKLTLEDSTPVDVANVRLIIRVASGVSGGNGVFKPMLRLASDTDSTYQPYAMTNKELTEDVDVINSQIKQTAVIGGELSRFVTNSLKGSTGSNRVIHFDFSGDGIGILTWRSNNANSVYLLSNKEGTFSATKISGTDLTINSDDLSDVKITSGQGGIICAVHCVALTWAYKSNSY